MKDILALVGLVFVVFSLIVLPSFWKGKDNERKELLHGVAAAVWFLIAFGVGSWLISVFYVHGISFYSKLVSKLGLPWHAMLWLPIVVIGVIGTLVRFFRQRTGRSDDKHHI
jgi:hypothetical protein